MNKITVLRPLALGVALMAASAVAQAGVCQTIQNKLDSIFKPSGDACQGLRINPAPGELEQELEEQGFLYVDLNVSRCNLGELKAPGLPGFGASGGGFDICTVLEPITGKMARDANKVIQDGVNETVNKVDEAAVGAIGTELTDFQMEEILKAQARKQNITMPTY